MQVISCESVCCKLLQGWPSKETWKLGIGYYFLLFCMSIFLVLNFIIKWSWLVCTIEFDSWKSQVLLHRWIFPYCVSGVHSTCGWTCSCQWQGNLGIRYNISFGFWIASNCGLLCYMCSVSWWISLLHSFVNSSKIHRRKLCRKSFSFIPASL